MSAPLQRWAFHPSLDLPSLTAQAPRIAAADLNAKTAAEWTALLIRSHASRLVGSPDRTNHAPSACGIHRRTSGPSQSLPAEGNSAASTRCSMSRSRSV
jgi:hypothetical protein